MEVKLSPYETAFLACYERVRKKEFKSQKDFIRAVFGAGSDFGRKFKEERLKRVLGEKVILEAEQKLAYEATRSELLQTNEIAGVPV